MNFIFGKVKQKKKLILPLLTNMYNTKSYTKLEYVCHRTGLFQSEGKGIRHLKVQGSHKMNGYCPTEIFVKILNDGKCEVEFVAQHIGHSDNLGHLSLNKHERKFSCQNFFKDSFLYDSR